MSDDVDTILRDLAKHHGREELSDSELQDIKRKVSNGFIDNMLDADVSTSATAPPEDKSEPVITPPVPSRAMDESPDGNIQT